MKKVIAQIVLITFSFSFSFLSFGQRNTDIGLSLSSDKEQRLVFEFRKPFNEKWRMTLGAAYGNYNYRYGNNLASFSDTSAILQSYNSRANKGSLRVGGDRQLRNSMFSIGGDIVLHYRSTLNEFRNIEYTQDSTGISPPTFYANYSLGGNAKLYKIHSFGAGFQLTGKMDVPLTKKLSLNLFAGPLISINSSFKIDIVSDPNNELEYLEGSPNITILDLNLVGGFGLRYALGK